MKKIAILMFMLFVLISTGNGQYYDDEYGYNDRYYQDTDYGNYYDDVDYDDNYLTYNYGYDNAMPYIRGFSGPVYYWTHPHRDIYFVLIGRRIFIMPGYSIRPILYRLGWLSVAMNRFIGLSCGGLHYYDNYVRFNYYNNHYRRYRYSSYYNNWGRRHYRDHYRNRRRNKSYFRDWKRVIGKRRVIKKRSLSPRNYDRHNKRNRNTTYGKKRSITSVRSTTRYNRNNTTNHNIYNKYRGTTSKPTVYKRNSSTRPTSSYNRRISKTTRSNYNKKPSSNFSKRISKTSSSRYSKKPSNSSRSTYSKQKVRKVSKSSSSKRSGNVRKVSKKRRR